MTKGLLLHIPIGHGEGNFFADSETLKRIEEQDQVVFRYADAHGRVTPEANPNGSVNNIAGIVNDQRKVPGMTPHADRAYESIRVSGGRKWMCDSVVHGLVTRYTW